MLTIRQFNETDQDYQAGVAIWNANWPDYLESVEEWKAWHATRNPNYFQQRLLGEMDGKCICYAEYGEAGWSDYAGKHYVRFEVHPNADFNSLAPQIYDYIMNEIAKRNPTKIGTNIRSDKREKIRFFEDRGYSVTMSIPCSLLDVTNFDATPFQEVMDKVRKAGIKIYSCAQLKELDPLWKHKLYDLRWEVIQDVPSTEPRKREPFEVFSKRLDDPISTHLHTSYVAVDTATEREDDIGLYVALSNLEYNSVNTTKGHTGLTGVIRTHRRRGIATAIKVHAISQAKGDGIEVIETDNEENNPMLDLNIRLGFEKGPVWMEYELVIDS